MFQFGVDRILVVLAIFAFLCAGCQKEAVPDRIVEAQKLAKSGKVGHARELLNAVSPSDEQWVRAQYLLGMMEWDTDSLEKACEYFDQIPLNGSIESLDAAERMSNHYLKTCRLSKAAEKLEYRIRENAGTIEERATLATILVLGGRRTRADYHLMELLKGGQMELKELVLLTLPDRVPPESEVFGRCLATPTEDALTEFGAARLDLLVQKQNAAITRLRKVVERTPKFAEAQSLLGETLLSHDRDQFDPWLKELPESVSNTSSIWFVKGLYARATGQSKAAVRCFWETVHKEPLHRRALYQLGQSLGEFNPEAAEAFSRRASRLAEAETLVERVLIDEGKRSEDVVRLIEILLEFGRQWEANAWLNRIADQRTVQQLPKNVKESLTSLKTSSKPRFVSDADLTKRFDFSEYPEPKSPESPSSSTTMPSTKPAGVRFTDVAQQSGLQFTFNHSPDSVSDGVRIFESTGGGIAVLDLEGDLLPDVFLTQGEPWPLGMNAPVESVELHDSCFRQVRGRFHDVSDLSGVSPEGGYGQGCCAGDVNNDGFSDLYISNVGRNRLLLNNGDGTFEDVTTSSGIEAAAWTTSCLLLDLNGDGNADLYDVNYLAGEAVYKVECSENECSVRNFPGEEDLVHLSNGDGTFRVIPNATPKENSKGLGIVALYSKPTAKPVLFVANDQVPNYLLYPNDDGTYSDQAALHGVAVNCDGQPTACMGVAAADVNGDRHIDLFVTNFESEANCFYLQDEQGFFYDSIRGSGLMAAGVPYVGWGTQFIDAENDQDLDLVVANGHVADFGKPNKQYDMPLQFFHNKGLTQFVEPKDAEMGDVIGRSLLGRSVATLDWNKDGRLDFIVSALQSPTLFATNETEPEGHFLRLHLRARKTARDAVGTVVELDRAETGPWQQLIAGDGYQATNERVLHFGLGQKTDIKTVFVSWPSGATESVQLLNGVDREYLIVEGLGGFQCR